MGITFNDIAGYKEEKRTLATLATALRKREEVKSAGGKLPKGLFLYGTNGVGKTILAKAFITESCWPVVEVSYSEMQKGISLREYLKSKFSLATSMPHCIVFIDELDKLIGDDGYDLPYSRNDTCVYLLSEINRTVEHGGLFLLFVSNREYLTDPAITRSGRIDIKLHIGLPTTPEREEILRHFCIGKNIDPSIDLTNISRMTKGLSGADLEALVNNAILSSVANGSNSVTSEDILDAYHDQTFGEKEKVCGLSLFHEKLLAYHEAGHAAAILLNGGQMPYCATVLPRGSTRGFVGEEDDGKRMMTVEDVEKRAKVSLAGMAAEEVFFGVRTTGSSTDLERAQRDIQSLIQIYGKYGFQYIDIPQKEGLENQLIGCSEHKRMAIEETTANVFTDYYEQTKHLILANKELVREIAKGLLKFKTLYKENLREIFKGYKIHRKNPRRAKAISGT